jgi:hypothetical protein
MYFSYWHAYLKRCKYSSYTRLCYILRGQNYLGWRIVPDTGEQDRTIGTDLPSVLRPPSGSNIPALRSLLDPINQSIKPWGIQLSAH